MRRARRERQPEVPLSTQDPSPALAVGGPPPVDLETKERHQILLKGGLTIGAGIITGNILGFVRVALTAYLLGTHSRADSLAVAVGPIDALNGVLINSLVFAFVPMLTARRDADRASLFFKLRRGAVLIFSIMAVAIVAFAPWLIRILAPGLDPAFFPVSVNILRVVALSTVASGSAAIYCALLYTDRRFAPAAFYQASLNL